jgi:hypothetical protein
MLVPLVSRFPKSAPKLKLPTFLRQLRALRTTPAGVFASSYQFNVKLLL